MLFKLFRRSSDARPCLGPDPALAEALEQRRNAIAFQPSKGFLKDQQQEKRHLRPPAFLR
jgi:CHASE2 domain-containing sensor protein